MIIYGWGDKTIKRYEDSHLECKNCGSFSHQFTVFQKYFHIFWIPFIPIGRKKIICECTACNDYSNTEKSDQYLSMTRTPLYMFSWVFIIAGFFLYIWAEGAIGKNNQSRYINNPKVGDVYVLTTEAFGDKESTIFMKLMDMSEDTLFVAYSSMYYESLDVYEMENRDFFVTNDIYYFQKDQLPVFKEDNKIRKVIRKYSESSNFNREGEVDEEDE